MQSLLQLSKEAILEIISGLYNKVDFQGEGSLSWEKFGDAMLLLCGRHFSVRHCQSINVV